MKAPSILLTILTIAVLGTGIIISGCSEAPLSRETLSESSMYISEVDGLSSTAGKRQEKAIRPLIETLSASAASGGLTVEYPFDGSVFPPEFFSPTFWWQENNNAADTWLIEIDIPGKGAVYVLAPLNPLPAPAIDQECVEITAKENPPLPVFQPPETNWTPSDTLWEFIKANTVGTKATLSICGFSSADPSKILSKGTVTLSTSKDPVGAPIFYRDVPMIGVQRVLANEIAGLIKPLPSRAQDIIKWSLRDVSKKESRVLLENMPTCANCHSFSADGSTLALDIDGPAGDKGGYAITNLEKHTVIEKDDIMSWNYSYKKKYKGLGKTLGFLSQMSPDGRHAVTTLNEQVFVSNYQKHDFIQVFYPTRGFLAIYSREEDDIHLLPGADNPEFVHCDGVWGPDGDYLVFARAEARDANIPGRPRPLYANDPNETPIQYDLYRIPFNEGKGGKPTIIEGASANGKSNTFPKVSPDGKWITFVKCNNGQLIRPDSRLWIVPAEGGEPREMNCNLDLMNSWHSFSPNSRWMAFSSKGITPYTRMFLTHIDENGNDTPPILVSGCTAANRAVNIPEFVNVNYDDFVSIDVPAVEFYRHHKRAMALGDSGKFKEALTEMMMALQENPDDIKIKWDLEHRTGLVLQQFGQIEGANEYWEKAIETDPNMSSEPYFLIALNCANTKEYTKAFGYFQKTVEMSPKHHRAVYYLALLSLEENAKDLYNPKNAIKYARDVNEMTASREPIMLELLAWAYAADGNFKEALTNMEKALEYAKPREIPDHLQRIEEKIALYKEGKA